MKILLINPPRNKVHTLNYGYTFSPALACLSAMLKENGYWPKVLDLFDNHNWREIREVLAKEKPDLVGITCLTNTRMNSFKLASISKKINPNVTVIIGGPHPTVMYQQVLENYPVDIVVIGEGDLTFLNVVKALGDGVSLEEVKGIAFKREARIIKTGTQSLIEDLNSLPIPDYYHLNNVRNGRILRTGVSIGRGCPYNCQFCASSSVWGDTYRAKSVENVVDEIECVLRKSEDKVIFIGDDMVTVTERETIRFCEEILNRKLDFRWYANARVDSISARTLSMMKKAGCIMICYGVESGSPKILRNINKRITVEQTMNAFRLTHQAGISCQATVMVGNPGESPGTIAETERLLSIIKPDYLWVSLATIYPGTGLYILAKQQRLIDDEYWLSNRIAPTYRGSMPLWKMFFYKWKMHLNQLKRKREIPRFLRSFLSEISPYRVWEGLREIKFGERKR